jgi:hypothetical protein
MTGFTFSADAIIDELEGHGVTANMGIIGAEAGGIYGDPNTYWAILNAITAITTHKKGGPKSGGYSARAVDFLIKAAERSAA